jgi:carbon storage regulator
MLILSRRANETLHIGADITVKVLGIQGNQVRLGLVAPREVVIDRSEVHQRKMAEYRAAPQPVAAQEASRSSAADMDCAIEDRNP